MTNRSRSSKPTRLGAIRDASFVSKCGTTLLVRMPDAASTSREYERMLERAGGPMEKVRRLPDCSERTGIEGPLPGIGRVACLDLGDSTAVVWLNESAGVIGSVRVPDDQRRAWKGYGPTWPPFVLNEQPA